MRHLLAPLTLPLLLSAAAPLPAWAEGAAPAERKAAPGKDAKVVHRVQKLADNVFCIFGQGGNVGLVVTAEHAVLIDDQFDNLVPGLLEAVRSVTSKPIKYLINTHWHGDHTGGNRSLEKQVVAIVAHSNTRRRLIEEQAKGPADKRGGLPELTVGDEDPQARARLDINLGGVEIHLAHFAAGHTDGDVIVGMPQTHTMHMGDLFTNRKLPYIDLQHGGSLAGYLTNVEAVLSFIPDDSRIIPGHGEVGGKKDLARFRDFLKAVQAHVQANAGKSGKELAASFNHKPWGDFQESKPFMDWEKFFTLASGKVP